MTNIEKQRIMEMRSAGAGCTRIAGELGISVNSVKSFCRRHCKEDPNVPENFQPENPEETDVLPESTLTPVPVWQTTPCEQCGTPVLQTPGRKKKRFCSDACRMEWWSCHREAANREHVHTFTCGCCGNIFTAYGVTERQFCSRSCAVKARFRKAACHD